MTKQYPQSTYTHERLRHIGRRVESTPLQYRLYVVEAWISRIVNNPEELEATIDKVTSVNPPVSEKGKKLRQVLATQFEVKLGHLLGKLSRKPGFGSKLVGEDLIPIPEINRYVSSMQETPLFDSLDFHPLLENPTPEEVYGEIRLHYYLERELIAPLFVGFADKVLRLYRRGQLGERLLWVLRDAKLPWIIAKHLSKARQWTEFLDPNVMNCCYINRAFLKPLSDRIDFASTPAVTAEETSSYLRQIGLVEGQHVTILDAGSLGSLLEAVKNVFGAKIALSAIFLMSQNPTIPSYIARISTRSWYSDLADELTMRKQYIVRDYLEDRLGEYCHRPERYRIIKRGDRTFISPEHRLTPLGNQLSAWASRQAMVHAASFLELDHGHSEASFDAISRHVLDQLFKWWLETAENPDAPNLMFYNWPKWSEIENFLAGWNRDTLQPLFERNTRL